MTQLTRSRAPMVSAAVSKGTIEAADDVSCVSRGGAFEEASNRHSSGISVTSHTKVAKA